MAKPAATASPKREVKDIKQVWIDYKKTKEEALRNTLEAPAKLIHINSATELAYARCQVEGFRPAIRRLEIAAGGICHQ